MSSEDDYPYDLGGHRRVVTTTSARAQRWFDRGGVISVQTKQSGKAWQEQPRVVVTGASSGIGGLRRTHWPRKGLD